jgi:signal transduction histidine kinase
MKFTKSHRLVEALVPWIPKIFRQGQNRYLLVIVCVLVLIQVVQVLMYPLSLGSVPALAYAASLVGLVMACAWGAPVSGAIHVGTLLGMALILFGASQTGGIFSPKMAWTLVLPFIPYFLIGRRAAYIWLGIALGAQALVGYLSWHGMVFERVELSLEGGATSLLTYGVLCFFLMAVPVIYEWMRRDALRTTRLQYKQLLEKQLELEKISKTREAFISTISHELRTPMNAIMGFNALMTSHFQDNAAVLKILKHCEHSAEHLMTVINDILDYSQLHTGRLSENAEKFELRELVHHAFELFALRIQEGSIQYACEVRQDVPQWVLTDRHRLMQILVNLLGNAVKFTHQGRVDLKVQKTRDGVIFVVQDTGIGISKEQQPHIFKRFSQADDTIQHRFGGNGLGLSISQKLAEMLGGTMGFESTLGQGSMFWLTLPLQEQGPVVMQTSALQNQQLRWPKENWRFLVVDDHKVNRLLVQQVLTQAWPTCQVLEAEDGHQALNVLHTQSVDVILMDMVMPRMDGTQTTRAIREQGLGGSPVVIIGLTANVNPADLFEFRASGLDDIVLKPFQPRSLTAKIEALLHAPVS